MKNNRRSFLKNAALAGATLSLPIAGLLAKDIENFDNNKEGFVIDTKDQETYLIAGRQAPVTIIVDKKKRGVKSLSLCIEDIIPGDGIPVHKHLNEEEIIYIQRGSGKFTLADKIYDVKAGSAVYVPKGVWHGLKNTGKETLQMMFSFSPAGFESYFREIGVPKGVKWKEKTPEEFAAIDKKYGIVYKR